VEHLTVSFLVSAQNGMAAYGAISFVLSIINRIASNLCLDLIKEKAFVLPPVIIRAGINTESSLRYEPFSSHSVTS